MAGSVGAGGDAGATASTGEDSGDVSRKLSGIVGSAGTPFSPGRLVRLVRFESENRRAFLGPSGGGLPLAGGDDGSGGGGGDDFFFRGELGARGLGLAGRTGEMGSLEMKEPPLAYRALDASEPVKRELMRRFQRWLIVESASEAVLRLLSARLRTGCSSSAFSNATSDSDTSTWSTASPSEQIGRASCRERVS